ncbi:O-antigen ligase family protein [Citricoccus sp. GCM10030269]|uniref:O-antigen ligase family protein n=1 Tax=Citricoccus sp. GCM10030269 TaxID=3273388 RepID=UPI00361A6982
MTITHRAVLHRGSLAGRTTHGGGSLLLRLQLFSLLGLPGYLVLAPVGASGSVPQLLALALTALWLVSAVLGRFNAWDSRHPGRVGLMCWVVVSCLSYAVMFAGLSGATDAVGRASADRWLLLIFAGMGLTLSVTQVLTSKEDVRRAVGWLLTGSSVCCVVAVIQFTTVSNPLDWFEPFLVGFENDGSATVFQPRGDFFRVAGTTMHPIELGVVCSMLLPLSVWWGLYSSVISPWLRWSPAALLLAGNVVTVSRSAILGLTVTAMVMIPHLPTVARRWSLIIAPSVLVLLFLAVPGMLSTLTGAATAGNSDPSISTRTDDYPLAWEMLVQRPILGHGPGTWIPDNVFDIFDNQYLLSAVTMGTAGVVAFLVYLLVPAATSLLAAKHAHDPELRLLAGSVAAAMFVAAVSAGTFDAMSFSTYALLTPLFVGLGGTAWLLVKRQNTPPPGPIAARAFSTPTTQR